MHSRRSLSLALAMATALAATGAMADTMPSAASLATHASMRGTLHGDAAGKIAYAAYYSESEDWPTLDGMTRDALLAEKARLNDSAPGIGGGIALTVVGGVLLFAGFVTTYAGILTYVGSSVYGSLAATGLIVIGFGVAMLITGAVLLPIGIVKLIRSIRERRQYSTRIDEINNRLDGLDNNSPNPYAPPPPPPNAVPPPPPPPPSALGNTPDAALLVSTF